MDVGPYSRTKHYASDTCAKNLQVNAADKIAIAEFQNGLA